MDKLEERIALCFRSEVQRMTERFDKVAAIARLIFDDDHLPVMEDTDLGAGLFYNWGTAIKKRSHLYVWEQEDNWWVSWSIYINGSAVAVIKGSYAYETFLAHHVHRVKRELFGYAVTFAD